MRTDGSQIYAITKQSTINGITTYATILTEVHTNFQIPLIYIECSIL